MPEESSSIYKTSTYCCFSYLFTSVI